MVIPTDYCTETPSGIQAYSWKNNGDEQSYVTSTADNAMLPRNAAAPSAIHPRASNIAEADARFKLASGSLYFLVTYT